MTMATRARGAAACCAVILGLLCGPARSAEPTVGVYFDEAGTQQTLEFEQAQGESQVVNIYVVVHGLDGTVGGFTAGLTIPEVVDIFAVYPVGTGLDGCGFPPWDLADMHCDGPCIEQVAPPQILMSISTIVPSDAADLVIVVGPPATAGPHGITDELVALSCSGGALVSLEPVASPYGAGAAAINPTPAVSEAQSTWGYIKSLY